MDLINLGNFYNEIVKDFIKEYDYVDTILHENFKNKLRDSFKDDKFIFRKFTTTIIRKSNEKKITFPNQWFCMAYYQQKYLVELYKYKRIMDDISDRMGWNKSEYESKMVGFKKKGKASTNLIEVINNYFESEINKEYMLKFVSDYEWWNGSKSIGRNDFYLSPTLSMLDLIHDSQTFMSEIADVYTKDKDLLIEAEKLFRTNRDTNIIGENIIVYGAPGTGKSYSINKKYDNITRIVFHRDYTYYDFVGSYKPSPIYRKTDTEIRTPDNKIFKDGEPIINYSFVPGPFIKILIKAVRNSQTKYTLLIEEINRANAASVFGDVFQLLDRDINGKSIFSITPSKEIQNYLISKGLDAIFNEGLYIPANLSIIATMNSADQGVFPLDSAFKRRWKYEFKPLIESGFIHENKEIHYGGIKIKWKDMLSKINERLKKNGIQEDRLIGPYFITDNDLNDKDVLINKLFIYLWDDVLRHKRNVIFNNKIRTYSELIQAYKDDKDVIGILERDDHDN
jgi:hypothetical protein